MCVPQQAGRFDAAVKEITRLGQFPALPQEPSESGGQQEKELSLSGLPFPGWQQLVGFISAAALIAYGMVPLALGALRRQDPRRPRPFRLPAASMVAPAAFVVASEILLFTGWAVIWKLMVAILIGFALLTLSMLTTNEPRPTLDWRSAVWFWPYLFGIATISYLSSFDTRTPSSIPLNWASGPT